MVVSSEHVQKRRMIEGSELGVARNRKVLQEGSMK